MLHKIKVWPLKIIKQISYITELTQSADVETKSLKQLTTLFFDYSLPVPKEYESRHDRVFQYLHWRICKCYLISTTANWYADHPEPVTEGKDVSILWDFPVHTDRTIQANRPDIIVKDKKDNICLLIDMSVPSDKNVAAKVFKQLSKYKDLEIEIEKMWHLKYKQFQELLVHLAL